MNGSECIINYFSYLHLLYYMSQPVGVCMCVGVKRCKRNDTKRDIKNGWRLWLVNQIQSYCCEHLILFFFPAIISTSGRGHVCGSGKVQTYLMTQKHKKGHKKATQWMEIVACKSNSMYFFLFLFLFFFFFFSYLHLYYMSQPAGVCMCVWKM